MSYTVQWSCDGCESRADTLGVEVPPQDWHTDVKPSIFSAQGPQIGEGPFDLCPICFERLCGAIKISLWARPAKAGS